MRLKSLSSIAIATLALASCGTPKDIAYFQSLNNGTYIESVAKAPIRLKPEDQLYIIVSTPDPQISQLFNLGGGQGGSSMMMGGGQNGGMTYTVDSDGKINFPVLGRISVEGLTREELAKHIEQTLKDRDLVKDPVVIAKFSQPGFSVFGEVGAPGRQMIDKDRVSIYDAMAMCGDVTLMGHKDNIKVIRENRDGSQKVYMVNLLDYEGTRKSPAYYIEQNDIIYVEPRDMRKRESTLYGNSAYNHSFWIGVATTAVSTVTMIATLLNLRK